MHSPSYLLSHRNLVVAGTSSIIDGSRSNLRRETFVTVQLVLVTSLEFVRSLVVCSKLKKVCEDLVQVSLGALAAFRSQKISFFCRTNKVRHFTVAFAQCAAIYLGQA